MNKSDINKLHKVIENEYFNIKKQFNFSKKNIVKNGQSIEDIYHNLLLKVLEYANLDNFNYIDYNSTLHYIYKTFRMRQKDLNKLKNNDQYIDNNSDDSIDLVLFISEKYESEQIEQSIFNKLFLNKNEN